MKKFFAIGILALSSLTLLSAKAYEITISSVTKVGSLQLKPGQYTVQVNGANAIFTLVETSKQFTTPVKVETNDKKFSDTRLDATKEGDTDVLKDIEIGGSKTKLDFGM